ncbi:hypothetical protein L3i20_v246560 [Paenibacillus sp. L3-i20]|nr:hypothetical protein L3i20_v246560 [Paenibacillus sp. L3-i20]
MTSTAERIREFEITYEILAVEQFSDAVPSIQGHVDPSIVKPYQMPKYAYMSSLKKQKPSTSTTLQTPYDDIGLLEISNDMAVNQDQRILREMDLTSDETIEFAKLNSSVAGTIQRKRSKSDSIVFLARGKRKFLK